MSDKKIIKGDISCERCGHKAYIALGKHFFCDECNDGWGKYLEEHAQNGGMGFRAALSKGSFMWEYVLGRYVKSASVMSEQMITGLWLRCGKEKRARRKEGENASNCRPGSSAS